MDFKNYCIVAFDNIEEIRDEVSKISEVDVNCLGDDTVTICTFSTVANVGEIEGLLSMYDGSFFVFELNKQTSGWYINDHEQYNHLFGLLGFDKERSEMEFTQHKKMKENHSLSGSSFEVLDEGYEEHVGFQGKTDKEIINEILDKGPEQLTDNDKKLIKFLTQNNNEDEKSKNK